MSAGLRAGYKRTEVGVIPEDWEVKRIGDIASVASGGTPRREVAAYWGGSIPWVTTSQVDFGAISEAGQFITDEGLQNSPAKLLPPGTLLMALYGQGKTRGKVGVLAMQAATNQACASISLYQGVSREFVLHFLTSRYEQIRKSSNSGSQENLNGNIVKGLLIASPSPTEQRAIALALSDVDALLAGLDRLIAKKRNLKQAAMQQLLTGQTRLPGFQGEWEVRPFAGVLNRVNAKAHQIQTIDYRATGRYPVVDQGKKAVVGFSDNGEQRFLCPQGGVIVFGDHTCIVKFIDFDFLVGADGTQLLVGKDGQCTRFHALQLEYQGVEPTGYNRHFKFLKEREFATPQILEQFAIAAVLSDMDADLTALEARRDKTRGLKQAMMQELLTGRIRLV